MSTKYVCAYVYTVKAGDTLYSIAKEYGISVSLLMQANRICNPYNLRVGRKLCIPRQADSPNMEAPPECPYQKPQQPMPMPTPTPMPTPMPMPMPTPKPTPAPSEPDIACKGTLYTVKAGDTLYMIAKRYKISLNALIDANPDLDCYNLRYGTKICIPR